MSHLYGLLPVWVFIWYVKSCFVLNFLSHRLHRMALLSSCIFMCTFRLLKDLNLEVQSLHSNCFGFKWHSLICSFNDHFFIYTLSQESKVQGNVALFPSWVSSWVNRELLWLKTFPQTEHAYCKPSCWIIWGISLLEFLTT